MGNITLGVKEEEEEDESATNICLETNPVKVEEFGEYVAEMHTKNNQGFVKQFQVNTAAHSCTRIIMDSHIRLYQQEKATTAAVLARRSRISP